MFAVGLPCLAWLLTGLCPPLPCLRSSFLSDDEELAGGYPRIRRGKVVETAPDGVWIEVTPVDLRRRPPLISIISADVDVSKSFIWGEELKGLRAATVGSFAVVLADR